MPRTRQPLPQTVGQTLCPALILNKGTDLLKCCPALILNKGTDLLK
jgi:hypothetical protein